MGQDQWNPEKRSLAQFPFLLEGGIVSFVDDVADLFLHKKEANVGPYLYGEPLPQIDNDLVCGEQYYKKLVYEIPDYYLYYDEVKLIEKVAGKIAKYVLSDSTVIEFGPGTEKAFRNKTLPFLKEIKQLHKYVAVDLCDIYLQTSKSIIIERFPETIVETIQNDFFKYGDLIVKDFSNPKILFKGSTIANLSKAECSLFLNRIYRAMDLNGILIIGCDANQNPESLKLAYDNETVEKFILNLFYRIDRDCPVEDFNPTAFNYRFEWEEREHCVKHNAVATESQVFKLNNNTIEVKKNDTFHIVSSYKYPLSVFGRMATNSGFEVLDYFIDDNQRMAIYVLKSTGYSRDNK